MLSSGLNSDNRDGQYLICSVEATEALYANMRSSQASSSSSEHLLEPMPVSKQRSTLLNRSTSGFILLRQCVTFIVDRRVYVATNMEAVGGVKPQHQHQ